MLAALEKSLGIVKTACNSVGISRNTHYEWLKNDPEYKSEVEAIGEGSIDFVESKLFEKINGVQIGKYDEDGVLHVYEHPPSDTAIIFFLKTRAKARGYVEKQEIIQKTTIEDNRIDESKLTDDELRVIQGIQRKLGLSQA